MQSGEPALADQQDGPGQEWGLVHVIAWPGNLLMPQRNTLLWRSINSSVTPLPACLPACLAARPPARPPACLPARPPARHPPVQDTVVVQVLHGQRRLQEVGPHLALPQKILVPPHLAAAAGSGSSAQEDVAGCALPSAQAYTRAASSQLRARSGDSWQQFCGRSQSTSQPGAACSPQRCQRVGQPEEGGEVASLHQLCDHTRAVVVPKRLVVAQQGGVVEGGQQAHLHDHRRPVSRPQRGAVCEL